MSDAFFERPILNTPYEYPARHWELDESGQPTETVVPSRRRAKFISPIPAPRKRKKGEKQKELLEEGGLSTERQGYTTAIINEVRRFVDAWRAEPDARNWHVTAETRKLLEHWRHHDFTGIRPFFCQVEAVETAIWLTEVAPHLARRGDANAKRILEYLKAANEDAVSGDHPVLPRLALKLATGAGKTTVMAMLIAWQTVNAARRPGSKLYTRGFLVVAPGITIKDRLRVLRPNDPDSYFKDREIVPRDMLREMQQARIVITNFHAFKLRDKFEAAGGTRDALKGWREEDLKTLETEGEMLRRVMPELMDIKGVMVLNDEAHHCYRGKPGDAEEADYKGEDRKEAKQNDEEARLWISGLEAVQRKLGVRRVVDLSATPFFLRGSGYAEGTIFPWTMSDFSLMDAIECGIVKLPRVPVADNVPGEEMPVFRNLWEHIAKEMPKKGRGKAGGLDPLKIPVKLQTALDALYKHYEKTFANWQDAGIREPPCFIVVCNNTSTSKLVHDYIAGFHREPTKEDEPPKFVPGRLELFRNYDGFGEPYARPRTLLIDSHQLEAGDGLDKKFRDLMAGEIEQFRGDIRKREGVAAADAVDDADLLREVMNTVGKVGKLGESVRCVVSVSMLTEGWDANNVTHILGVRAFGTQLLCEQVIGRALRRQSYEAGEDGLFPVEYADVFGIPFDFTAEPVEATPTKPRATVTIKAVKGRDACEIRFPRVEGYRVEPPAERLRAKWHEDHAWTLTPDQVSATQTRNEGIIGQGVDLTLEDLERRPATIVMHLTKWLMERHWRDEGGDPRLDLYGQLRDITRDWFENHFQCKGGTKPAQLLYAQLADQACGRITRAISAAHADECPVKAVLSPYNPTGSTSHVLFNTSKEHRWKADGRKCHLNELVLDSDWEGEFCRLMERDDRVLRYVKNHGLGLEIPYLYQGVSRRYRPDFIVVLDDGRGPEEPLHLLVEVKGFRGEDVKDKSDTARTLWVPGVNHLGTYGRWAFVELRSVWEMGEDLEAAVGDAIEEAFGGE